MKARVEIANLEAFDISNYGIASPIFRALNYTLDTVSEQNPHITIVHRFPRVGDLAGIFIRQTTLKLLIHQAPLIAEETGRYEAVEALQKVMNGDVTLGDYGWIHVELDER